MINQDIFEAVVNRALSKLYESEKHFVDDRVHERTIVADFIAPCLRREFPDWTVNTDFNREGVKRTPKKDLEGNKLVPDIIVHKRGPDGPNCAVVQVKGYWNREKRSIDEEKLRRLRVKHGYVLLYRIELKKEGFELIRVE